jgi:hypothetical protein
VVQATNSDRARPHPSKGTIRRVVFGQCIAHTARVAATASKFEVNILVQITMKVAEASFKTILVGLDLLGNSIRVAWRLKPVKRVSTRSKQMAGLLYLGNKH